MVNVNEWLDKFSDAEADADEALSLQGSIDELEGERDSYIEQVRSFAREVDDLLEDADGDEDWYADLQYLSDDAERLLQKIGA